LGVGEKPCLSGRQAFEGFPAGARAIAIPNMFFTALLPQIDDRAELVVTVYFFFAQARKKGQPRFLRAAELAAEEPLAAALGSPAEGGLRRGLDAAVKRGTLLRLAVEQYGADTPADTRPRVDEMYCLNTPAGRRAVAAAKAGRLKVEGLSPEPEAGRELLPNVFALYEENIGTIGPVIADELKDAEERYPREWIDAAFREAVSLNKRSWRYIEAILRRWEAEGPDYEKAGRDTEGDQGRRRSLAGRYRNLVRR
jgi:DnaD/phage-associated family protein